jgi:hypothetical protein
VRYAWTANATRGHWVFVLSAQRTTDGYWARSRKDSVWSAGKRQEDAGRQSGRQERFKSQNTGFMV